MVAKMPPAAVEGLDRAWELLAVRCMLVWELLLLNIIRKLPQEQDRLAFEYVQHCEIDCNLIENANGWPELQPTASCLSDDQASIVRAREYRTTHQTAAAHIYTHATTSTHVRA